jgi:hypothetical protein
MKPMPPPKMTIRLVSCRFIDRRSGSSGYFRNLGSTAIQIIVAMIPTPRPIKGNPPLGEQSNKFIICDPFDYPELPPPIRRGRGGLGRLGSERRVQQIANRPNPIGNA